MLSSYRLTPVTASAGRGHFGEIVPLPPVGMALPVARRTITKAKAMYRFTIVPTAGPLAKALAT